MHSEQAGKLKSHDLILRGAGMLMASAAAGLLVHYLGLSEKQVLSTSIFMLIILSTLLFWAFRLAIAFVGIGLLFATRVITLNDFVHDTELPIIMFLVGMMVIVGVLKELGLFTWIIQAVINCQKLSGVAFITIIVYLSAILACAVDEVTSIVFIATLIFQVCDTLKIKPVPYIIISVISTNIGSFGTMLGNPVGILVGDKGGFSFFDFIYWSFPVMLVCLTVTLGILLAWFRKDIALLDERLKMRRDMGLSLGPLVQVPYKKGLAILVAMIAFIGSHHFLEQTLELEPNTILIVAPLVVAGLLMIWRNRRARHYIETEVEWWTLLFFMMLFAVAGSLKHSGVTAEVAEGFTTMFGGHQWLLAPAVMVVSAIGSAFVDNVVFVAAFVPVVEHLNSTPLWWALLWGACLGGNITMIGSTANIVALGMLEKRYRQHIGFGQWLKIGGICGTVTIAICWGALMLSAHRMPPRPSKKQTGVQKDSAAASEHKLNNVDKKLDDIRALQDFSNPPAYILKGNMLPDREQEE